MKFTWMISSWGNKEQLLKTCESIAKNKSTEGNTYQVKILFLKEETVEVDGVFDDSFQVETQKADAHKAAEAFQKYKEEVQEGYLQFLEEGVVLGEGYITELEKQLSDKEAEEKPLLFCNILNEETEKAVLGEFPVTLEGVIFHQSWLKNHSFFHVQGIESCGLYAIEAAAFMRRTQEKKTADNLYVMVPPERIADQVKRYLHASKKKWYFDSIRKDILPFIEEYIKKNGELDEVIQNYLFWGIKNRFMHNCNLNNTQVIHTDAELEEFQALVRSELSYIRDSLILGNEVIAKSLIPAKILSEVLYGIKYPDSKKQLIYEKMKAGYCNTKFLYEDEVFHSVFALPLTLKVMNYEDGCLVMDFCIDLSFYVEEYKLYAIFGEKEYELEEIDGYGDIEYFGRVFASRKFYRFTLRDEEIGSGVNDIQFDCRIGERKTALTLAASRFPARLTTKYANSYWIFGKHIIQLKKTKSANACLRISPCTKKTHLIKELKLQKELFKKDKHQLLFRACYWATKLFYRPKHVWITFDKMYKAGDNGEYLYKYMMAHRKEDGIKPYYLMTKGYEDAARLEKEGYKPLYYSTFRHKYLFLNSEIVAATHANIPVFSGFSTARFAAVQDLFQGKVVCIQHGLTVQDLPHNQNRMYDNLVRYYLASPVELKNVAKKVYGFEGTDALQMTGLARYDGLEDREKKQILLIPTWRNYIAMPASIGNVRPYSETFKDTVYYRVFNELLNNPMLRSACERYGYRFLYVPHPTLASQTEDFQVEAPMEVKTPIGLNYEELFRESSLMITDFSGVQFDFAYMRKPLLYYHPEELPAHYESSGLDYEKTGFGEICKTEEELVQALCQYMKENCKMSPEYKKRADDFFAFDDKENCKRIYEDLLQLKRN